MKAAVQIFAAVSGGLAALMSIPLICRFQWPAPASYFLKLYASALSPVFFLVGVLVSIVSVTTGSVVTGLIGFYIVSIFSLHIFKVTRPPTISNRVEEVFGLNLEKGLTPEQKSRLLPKRTVLRLPVVPPARVEQNISFATIAVTGRRLLCDLWQPPETIPPSGLAFIYLHGSAWFLLDKDFGTRPFFSQLAARGHVIMDVAYRLAPETDMMGMVNDAKRAIVWMREHADTYGVNPNTIVIGGGSAGAQVALLTAYTSHDPQFAPIELEEKDVDVCAVISLYGPSDLEAMYYHSNQHITTRATPDKPQKSTTLQLPKWIVKGMGKAYHRLGFDKGFENGSLATLLGCHPDECRKRYALFSPITHVHAGCPPTLLLHGEHDLIAPVKSSVVLHARLEEEKIPTILHVFPQADHGFDLIMPKISPSAHGAFYDIERFLALQIKDSKNAEMLSRRHEEYQSKN